jgi:hypothetical protein
MHLSDTTEWSDGELVRVPANRADLAMSFIEAGQENDDQ